MRIDFMFPTPPSPDDQPTLPEVTRRPHVDGLSLRLARGFGRTGGRLLKWLMWAFLALGIAVSVAWAILLSEILPRVDEWRADLAQQATQALGVPVRMERVVGRADGIWPTLLLREVHLLDERGQVALRLPEIEARLSLTTFSPQAWLDGELRLDRLVVVAPELDVRRDRAGRIHVAGLRLQGGAATGNGGAGADWVLSQSRIQIRGGTVRWHDEYLGAPPLALQQVELELRNRPSWRGRVHDMKVSATPPAGFGQRFEIQASMTQPFWLVGQAGAETTRPADWQSWSGSVQARFPLVDVQRLRQHVRLPVEVSAGRGALAARLDLQRGRVRKLGLQADVQDLNLRLAPDVQPLAFRRLKGELSASNDEATAELGYKQLAFTLTDGLQWPASSGSLSWRHAPWPQGWPVSGWGDNLGGELRADRLDLALLDSLADRLPLSPQHRSRLAEMSPRGVIEGLSWSWEGPANSPQRYRLAGRVKGLALAESPELGRPGLAGANVVVQADEGGGRAGLQLESGWLAFPGVFEQPRIDLGSLQANVTWRVQAGAAGQAPRWQVDVKDARFANDQAAGRLEATWRTGDAAASRLPGSLSLKGTLQRAEGAAVWRYLPLTIGQSARDYVRQAIREGRAENAEFSVDGALDGFPFKDDLGGRFRMKVPLRGVVLDYAPAAITGDVSGSRWSPFTSLDGELLFEGQRMLIRQASGRLGGIGTGSFVLRDVEGRIEDLGANDPVLTIGGQGEGPLQDALSFLSTSPLSQQLGSVLTRAQGQGRSALKIALDIPLNRSVDTRLKGEVLMREADRAAVRLGGNIPLMSQVRGRVSFTESLLDVNARARVWGQEMAIEGKRTADGALRFNAQGSVTAESLRQADEYPFVARLAPRLSGEAPVSVTVTQGARTSQDAPPALPEVQVSTSLRGVASGLPAPLNKAVGASWPLKVTYRIEDADAHHDAIVVDLGNPQAAQITSATMPWLRVDLRRDIRQDEARITRGQIHLVQPGLGGAVNLPPLPAKGVAAQLVLGAVDLDAWQEVALTLVAGNGGAQAPDDGILPETITLQSTALSWQQRTLRNVSATIAHPAPDVWRASIDSPQLAGQVEWLPEKAPLSGSAASSRVVARLSRLLVPPSDAQALQAQAAARMMATESATSLPALDVVIDRFEWRGLDLGRFEVEAVNRLVPMSGGAPLPEWRVTRMRLANADAQLDATGNWTALGAQQAARKATTRPRAAFGFTLDLHNSGGLLGRLGLPQALRGGKGKLTGQVSWLGSPLEPDVASLSGDIKVLINEGQFLKADAGFGRLLGVLSLQSLPRRFLLDFRDVFQPGFAFDNIDGDVRVAQGVATTRNLRMRSVQALILMEGQADLNKETQNLHVYVIPEINAGTASLAYAAINPVVGLGTFLAQMLLRKQVSEAATREFWVTGTWAEPQVDKVAPMIRPTGDPVNAAGADGASPDPKPRKSP